MSNHRWLNSHTDIRYPTRAYSHYFDSLIEKKGPPVFCKMILPLFWLQVAMLANCNDNGHLKVPLIFKQGYILIAGMADIVVIGYA
jgi:hypothetical protein